MLNTKNKNLEKPKVKEIIAKEKHVKITSKEQLYSIMNGVWRQSSEELKLPCMRKEKDSDVD